MSEEEKYLKKYLKKEKLAQGLEELSKGRSVQYIVGNVDFCGNIINVDERVLIPRFETELLVEKTAEFIKQIFGNRNIRIVDLGTGSGCIAISLKKLFGDSEVYGIDKSLDALKCASNNATENNVNINFSYGDMTEFNDMSFDVYISNPPYIAYDEEIMEVVKNNEPAMALYADEDGLFYYKKIIQNLCKLDGKFLMAFEIGEKQADSIVNIIFKYFTNVTIRIEKDYNKRDRFIFVYRN